MKRSGTKEPLKSAIEADQNMTDRLAIQITDRLGNLWFLGSMLIILTVYMAWNLHCFNNSKVFDPFPFDALDTALSLFAVILSITVLISQNRQRRLEKIREQVEFEVNVRAEHEITKILTMLHDIQQKLGIHKDDPELEKMKKEIDLEQIHEHAKAKEGQ